MTRNAGSCSDVNRTSCRMNSGDGNFPSMAETTGFNLSVVIAHKNGIVFQKIVWIENLTECRKCAVCINYKYDFFFVYFKIFSAHMRRANQKVGENGRSSRKYHLAHPQA